MNKILLWGLAVILALGLVGSFVDCDSDIPVSNNEIVSTDTKIDNDITQTPVQEPAFKEKTDKEEKKTTTSDPQAHAPVIDLINIPAYSGKPYVAVNNNIPYFTADELTTTSFEKYSSLDSLGRCGVAFACIGKDIMPSEERSSIGSVKPSGWQTIRYEFIDGRYLYNRCHLIGYQLTGENANTANLITGTRELNMEGMLPFENNVANYVERTKNHVMYRVTPVFEGNNLVATGVLIEAISVEDSGNGICLCVFAYNEQPGITINHANGDSFANDGSAPYGSSESSSNNDKPTVNTPTVELPSNDELEDYTYIANKNSKKFHYPSCSGVKTMKDSNKKYLDCSRDKAIVMGYEPCGTCKP